MIKARDKLSRDLLFLSEAHIKKDGKLNDLRNWSEEQIKNVKAEIDLMTIKYEKEYDENQKYVKII